MPSDTKQMKLLDKLQLTTALAPRLTGNQFKVAYMLLLPFHNSKTGKCFPSYRQLADMSDTSRPTAVTTIKKLQELAVIKVDASNGGWNKRNTYHLIAEAARSLIGEKVGQQNNNGQTADRGVQSADHHVPSAEHQCSDSRNAYNNEGIKEGTKKNSHASKLQADFDEWYALYPRRVGKAQAFDAYENARKKASQNELIAGAKNAVEQYRETDERYVPHPKTWLAGERWLDEKPDPLRLHKEMMRGAR
jgi:hypothetical protein